MAKRKLYRNVDGRILILFMPLKWNFINFLWSSILFVAVLFGMRSLFVSQPDPAIKEPTAVVVTVDREDAPEQKKDDSVFVLLLVSVLFISGNFSLNAEFKFRESGLQFVKNYLRYRREGKIVFERSLKNVGLSQRLFWNKIKKQFK